MEKEQIIRDDIDELIGFYVMCPVCLGKIKAKEITKESIICHDCQTVWINTNRIKGQIDDF